MGKSLNRRITPWSLLSFAAPSIIMMVFMSLYTIVDGSFVSRFVGSNALSSLNIVYPVVNVAIAIAMMLASGGNAIISKYLGEGNKKRACESLTQFVTVCILVSLVIVVISQVFLTEISRLLGSNEVLLADCKSYLGMVSLFIPACMLQTLFQMYLVTAGRPTMGLLLMIGAGIVNAVLDYVLIVICDMGVAGAALSTLISRIFCAVVVIIQLRKEKEGQEIVVRDYFEIRPDWSMIRRILGLGIPSGIENSMFQLGKLAIQSTVSTLGTTAIAAQAMTNILENLNGIAAIGVGVGLMTIVGQCLGAGRQDEAVYYIKKLCVIAEVIIIISCLGVFALTKPITILGGMEKESADMCFHMVMWITIVKPLVWIMAFIPGYGLRAAGDVKFSMITSCTTMWVFRFCLCVYLIRVCGMGPMAVWIGMFTDWTVRGIVFSLRFKSGKWMEHRVV